MSWDQRYAGEEYVYGTEPNAFLREHVNMLSSPVLSLAEGEGRNAVFLASQGLDVLGVDGSTVGLAKAQKLAKSQNVSIRTQVTNLATYTPSMATFRSVVSIFAHMPSQARKRLHQVVAASLLPGGVFLLEAYAKSQIGRDTGGPKDIDMLLTSHEIEQEFPGFDIVLSREIEREVLEGRLHTGLANVVQFIARKPAD